ncbi:MAG: AraC family transcriptional regulator [Eubacterium sp.]|nr:AraC family transcriptional regulator [Eubacterium sp.]
MKNIQEEVTQNLFTERESEVKHPSYNSEMAFYNLIADGKMDAVRDSLARNPKSDSVERGILSNNPTRNAMYHMVSMVALVTRVCIRRGMPQDIAYKLSDAYIQKADICSSAEEIRAVQLEAIEEYTKYMAFNQHESPKSKQIRLCIDYIRSNTHRNVTVAELAELADLNETYLSKLFKKEMGCTVSEFIRNEKIEEACWLLSFSDKSSIEIATVLAFSSHSYFISVFKKVKGVTPKEYRNTSHERL